MSQDTVRQSHGPHHASPPEAVVRRMDVDPRSGLSSAEARARRDLHGPNALPASARRSAFERFLLQFHDILIYVLLAAGAITAVLGHWIDSGVIFGVVVINAIIGFVQEGKAERALDAIRDMLSPRAQVLRDGHRREVPAEELVPGDIVFLASGDKVPADLRLVEVRSLRVEEAALTGESVPVDKAPDPVGRDVPLGDRASMAYSGTLVAYGQATGVVVATGAKTEIGRISEMLGKVEELTTPLLRQLAAFGRTLTWVILGVAAFAFAFGTLVRDYSAGEMFLAAVGLAVAAIPEGLPAIMTITLAIGVQRMAARNAIIRRLPSVEALGSVTVICSDKTGTLTRNEMTVQRVACADRQYVVTGSGYIPHGGFEERLDEGSRAIEPAGALLDSARAAMLCNDAHVRREGEDWTLAGDPTEGALLVMAMKAGLDGGFEREALPRTDVIPFESEHRFMATLHHDHEGHGRIYLKGAPERVLELCARARSEAGDGELDIAYWHARMHEIAADGMRLLAVAVREDADAMRELCFADVEGGGFTLLALFGLSDPPREEAVEAVARCRAAGIRVKMITGDHAATARAIGVRLGLDERVQAITGADLEKMDDAALAQAAADNEVFARASPEHKLRLVTALQSRGEVVAMTGDGVNDAPALKRAEVGVAMGNKGTEAAKEAAEVVLADDNFASIAAAVEEGRTVYDNLRKAIAFILPTNLGQGGIVLCAVLLGITMPITPAQILWVNMITAVTLALALAFEQPERDIMRRPPRAADASLLDRFVLWRIFFVGVLLVAGGMGFFLWEIDRGQSLELARTAAVNAVLVGEAFYLFNMRSFRESVFSREGLTGNRYVWLAIGLMALAQLAFTYAPFMHALFGSAALDAATWLRVLAFGVVVLIVVELEKLVVRLRADPKSNA
ncbi:cation-transporting P-type ATPase [Pseudazoarcus pumilus]|uniref:Carbonate dehydratase n=1 Tax=Pseudazoarcus pumilus TaxID=2067960 RepID=A0A2I6S5A4_9RHOO|nr:cation-transporting P-type ATPase [Pseudazoarcus pumilus]AUN94440.1 carbonate dehydratase [Pseudazoarcus pumilus]